MKKLIIPLALLCLGTQAARRKNYPEYTDKGDAASKAWGGYWWSMLRGELALGWNGLYGRKVFSPYQVNEFSNCLSSDSIYCKDLIKNYSKNNAIALSPLMKFDLYIKRYTETYAEGPITDDMYSRSASYELNIHYIGNDKSHKYWGSKGFAGKCIGWALSTYDHSEPTQVKNILGIDFTPADIKGILATQYNAASMFTQGLSIGTEYKGPLKPGMTPGENKHFGDKNSVAYKDVTPLQLVKALQQTVKKGVYLEADLDPDVGVWNYPIHKYDIKYKKTSGYTAKATITIEFANDEVKIDDVFTTDKVRRDLKTRTYTANFRLPKNWSKKLEDARSSQWTGESIHNHPDALVLGMEEDWKFMITDLIGANTGLEAEFNVEIFKSHDDGFTLLVEELLYEYYLP